MLNTNIHNIGKTRLSGFGGGQGHPVLLSGEFYVKILRFLRSSSH